MSSHVFIETGNEHNPDLVLPEEDDVEVISIGSSSSVSSSLPPPSPPRRRCIYPLTICVLVIALVIAVSVAVSNNTDDRRSTTFAAAKKDDQQEATDIPSDVPSLLPSSFPTTLADLDSIQPTVAPVVETSAPSVSAAPTPCVSTMSVEKSCYVIGAEPIRISFSQCDPLSDDWIGVFFSGMSQSYLTDDYFSWVWACGTQTMQCESASNTVLLETPDVPGSFRAFLVKDAESSPYESVAVSATFTVDNAC
jgi:hypothetical protein